MENPLTVPSVLSALRSREFVRMLGDQLIREHLTHQQSVMGGVKQLVDMFAANGYEDLRNQDSKSWARKASALDDVGFPNI